MKALLLFALMAPLPALAAPPAQAVAAADDRAALEALNHDWLTAYKTHDGAVLGRILADDFEAVYPGGRVLRKADVIGVATNAQRVIREISWDGLKIMVFGDVAVVSGRAKMAGTGPDGPFAGTNDYADVYVKRGGVWRAVSAHVVRAAE